MCQGFRNYRRRESHTSERSFELDIRVGGFKRAKETEILLDFVLPVAEFIRNVGSRDTLLLLRLLSKLDASLDEHLHIP